MEYSIDNDLNRFISDYDSTMEHYIYDDFAIEELENCHTLNIDNFLEEVDEGINFIDM